VYNTRMTTNDTQTKGNQMTTTQKTIELYRELGILTNCKSLGLSFNHESNLWEVWGHFQSSEGRRNARVATFDNANDAVDFERSAL
jgi:hypothetical protein